MSNAMQALIDRVAADPDFAQRLSQDPWGATRAEGYELSEVELRQALGVGGDEDLAQALQARLSHSCGGQGAGSPSGFN